MGTAVVTWTGDVDLATAPIHQASVDSAIDDPTTEAVVLDLCAVTFLDCAGLAVLLRARRRAAQRGVDFSVQHIPPLVARVLSLTGTASIFE